MLRLWGTQQFREEHYRIFAQLMTDLNKLGQFEGALATFDADDQVRMPTQLRGKFALG
jgi:hypothetical protein